MRRSVPTALMLLATAILAVVTALDVTSAQNAHRSPAQTGPTPPPPPFSGTPVISTPITTGQPSFRSLSHKQQVKILGIVKSDRTFKKIIGKKSYRVSATWLWTTKTGAYLGGVLTVRLKKAATINGTWIQLNYDCTEHSSPPYSSVKYQAKYGNVTAITLYVNAKAKSVAGTKPLGFLIGKPVYPANYTAGSSTTCQS